MGMFCKDCHGILDRTCNLCPKCDAEEIEAIKEQAKVAEAKKAAENKRKKTSRKKLHNTSQRAIREIINTYNKKYCEHSTGWLRKNARMFYERLRDSPVFYLLPVRGKRHKKLYAVDEKRVEELRKQYQFHKGRIAKLDECGRMGIIFASFEERAKIKASLLDRIEDEVIDYLLFKRDELTNSKSLCDDLEFVVNQPSIYINNMLRKSNFPKELSKYREHVLRSQAAKRSYEDGKGVASLTTAELKAASKKGYAAFLGECTSEDHRKYGAMGLASRKRAKKLREANR